MIFEEFKGTDSSEIILDQEGRRQARLVPIDILKSGTRKVELLVDKSTLAKMYVLRRILAPMGTVDAIEFLRQAAHRQDQQRLLRQHEYLRRRACLTRTIDKLRVKGGADCFIPSC